MPLWLTLYVFKLQRAGPVNKLLLNENVDAQQGVKAVSDWVPHRNWSVLGSKWICEHSRSDS
ncbi:MAG TPA: hypothetical protein DD396_03135 [Bacteroidetes bacterium]|nr:hypothetical protein [Bacteroidota bacterium]